MPNTVPSIYMTMPVPVPTVDPGPQYATDLNSCLGILDSHTHAPGQGQQITPAGINITTDLSFGGNNSINLRSVRFTPQGGALATGSDVGCVYVASADLYYNDTNGNQIRLTQSGAVAGTPGSIANLLPPASVTYVTGSQTFVFQSSTATAGNIDAGSIIIRQVLANAKGITLSSPASLAANYTLTLPAALPATSGTKFLTVDGSGNVSDSVDVDNTSIGLSNNQIVLAARPISTPSSAVGIGGIATSISTNGFSTSSTAFLDVTQSITGLKLQTKLITTGTRPVFVGFTCDGTTGLASAYICNGGGGSAYSDILLMRNSTGIARTEVGLISGAGAVFGIHTPGSIYFLDYPTSSGPWTYSVKIQAQTLGQTLTLQQMRIITYEM